MGACNTEAMCIGPTDAKTQTVSGCKKKPVTVDETFDEQIKSARKRVEELCVKKAKLEALNMLHMPYDDLRTLLEVYRF